MAKLQVGDPLNCGGSVRRSRWLRLGGAVTAVVLMAGAGCALSRSGGMQQNCTAPGDCEDGNPCTVEGCDQDGFCLHTNEPDASRPAAEQTPQDCSRLECAAGEVVSVPDDADRPADEPCKTYSCDSGTLSEHAKGAGEPCEGEPGVCNSSGQCDVVCTTSNAAEVCDDLKACTTEGCDLTTSSCTWELLNNVEAPGAEQVVGDCQIILCSSGTEQPTNDDSDLPNDHNDCTLDQCNQGVASNDPVMPGLGCADPNNSQATVCDDVGSCVECNGPADCAFLPADDECQTRTCVNHACGQTFAADGKQLSLQQLGDCKTKVCDGSGGTKQVANGGDLPFDGNDCTQDVCTGSTPSNPPEPQNNPCGNQGQLFCNGTGTCVGCTNNNQCPSDTFCRDNYCNGQGQCAFTNTANNTPLPNPDQTPGDCKELRCNGSGAIKSVAVNDPGQDGIQCTYDWCLNGAPIHPARPINTLCSQNGGSYCDGNKNCVECNGATQCPTAPDCQYRTCSSHNCGTGNESNSTPAPGSYQTGQDCRVVLCDGSGNVGSWAPDDGDPPPDEPNICTLDQCDGAGNPIHPPVSNGKICDDALFCTQTDTCQGGNCTGTGSPCPGADGDSNCQESCDETADNCTAADPDSSVCSDGSYCNGTETCTSGICGGSSGDPCPGPDGDADCQESCAEPNSCGGNDPPGSACNGGVCDGSGICTCAYAPTPPGGSCPVECTGGCDNVTKTCKIDCIGDGACDGDTITCPQGWNCLLTCDSGGGGNKDACKNVQLSCPDLYACNVVCQGKNGCDNADVFCTTGLCSMSCDSDPSVCKNTVVNCGVNECSATCAGGSKPQVKCGSSCSCTPCP